jgi:hypothetical protein
VTDQDLRSALQTAAATAAQAIGRLQLAEVVIKAARACPTKDHHLRRALEEYDAGAPS